MKHAKTPFQFFLRRMQAGTVVENPFPDIGITNTSPSPTEFWVTLSILEPIFLEK
jgi:hypothetical protein